MLPSIKQPWIPIAAVAIIVALVAIRRIVKASSSDASLTPVSDQWLAQHKRDPRARG